MHGTLGDIWIFNTGDRTWITPVAEGKPPCPREMHTGTMVTDGRLLVFGGRSPAGQVHSPSKPHATHHQSFCLCTSSCRVSQGAGLHVLHSPRMISNACTCMYSCPETLPDAQKPLVVLTILEISEAGVYLGYQQVLAPHSCH